MAHQSSLIEDDILTYLEQHNHKQLLRFITCGSVDDGKSSLIGRLLHDSKLVYEDQLAAIAQDSRRFGSTENEFDLALLVDGLQSEREQGITIDVAYRYFSTEKRKFIIADTPGHEQYTRNMATGASTADLAVILVDARKGLLTQTRRHSFLVSLLGIRHVILAINKMDLVDYQQSVFERIKKDYLEFAQQLSISDIHCIPISAINGDNVVYPSQHMTWYRSQSLMSLLDTIDISLDYHSDELRFPVQYVNRPHQDFRGYCGSVQSGTVRKGDSIKVLPSEQESVITGIHTFDGELEEARPPLAVTLTLKDEIDISHGDLIIHTNNQPTISVNLVAHLVWMHESPLQINSSKQRFLLKLGSRSVNAMVSRILHIVDINQTRSSQPHAPSHCLALNEIGLCQIELEEALAYDPYEQIPAMGSFILIDRLSNATVAAGMISNAVNTDVTEHNSRISNFEIELNALIRRHFPHWNTKEISPS